MINKYLFFFTLLISLTLKAQSYTLSSKEYSLESDDNSTFSLRVRSLQDYLHCSMIVRQDEDKVIKKFDSVVLPKNKRRYFNLGFQFLLNEYSNIVVELKNCQFIRPQNVIETAYIDPAVISKIIDSGLKYLKNKQKKETVGQEYFKGEWGSLMVARKGFAVLRTKKGTAAYDSNCFTTSSIVNSLANIYKSPIITQRQKAEIVEMLKLASNDVMACEDGGTFNFWHLVEIPSSLRREGRLNRVRSPNHFPYRNRVFYFLSNIVNDADDTAIAYLALDNIKKIVGVDLRPHKKIGKLFSPFRDFRNRHVFNLYDFVAFRAKKTEAFMTWLSHDELHVPYLPARDRQNIPLRTNDVDCVVNSNVLTALATYNELETDGVKQSCRYLNKELLKRKYSKCALYYPNKYMFPYAVSKAYKAGTSCLGPSKSRILSIVMNTQKSDGSWDSFKEYDDLIQSTALAIHTLINFYDGSQKQLTAINRGVQFLLKHSVVDENLTYWNGGIYFSGGTFARKRIVWTSDAYTTSLILEILSVYQNLSGAM